MKKEVLNLFLVSYILWRNKVLVFSLSKRVCKVTSLTLASYNQVKRFDQRKIRKVSIMQKNVTWRASLIFSTKRQSSRSLSMIGITKSKCYKTFFCFVSDTQDKKARMFKHNKLFQPSLVFASKARSQLQQRTPGAWGLYNKNITDSLMYGVCSELVCLLFKQVCFSKPEDTSLLKNLPVFRKLRICNVLLYRPLREAQFGKAPA